MKVIPKKVGSIDDLMFDVAETRIAFDRSTLNDETNFKLTKEYKAAIRTDNQKLIAIVPKTTTLITNREVIETALKGIEKVGFKYTIDHTQSYYTDQKMRLALNFPELTLKDDSNEGQIVNINLFNSYDTSNAVKAFFGALRLICTNGMIIGKLLGKFYRKHTSGFSINEFAIMLEQMYKKLPQINERFAILESLEITDDLMKSNKEKLGTKMHNFVDERIYQKSIASDHQRVINQLQLLNLMTYYISHNVPLHRREVYQNQVAKIFEV